MSVLAALLLIQAAPAAEPDWGARLATDATAFRDAVLDSHPGPVDRENPGFRTLLIRAYAQAITRAKTASSFAHYVWALRELSAAFDDGHVGIDADFEVTKTYSWSFNWPGFVTALRGNKHVVVASDEATVRVGATLIGCDGIAADLLAEKRIGHFAGRWGLRSRREAQSAQLFLPPQNPWLATVKACTFANGGKVALNWRPLEAARRTELLAAAVGKRFTTGIGVERLADGTVWINLGSFDGDPESASGRSLNAVAAEVARWAPEIRQAPRIVFDLRGNNGGSSSWSNMIAGSIWGRAAADRAVPDSPVAWRASQANYDTLVGYVERFGRSRATNPDSYTWAITNEAGLRSARARGEQLWLYTPGAPAPADPNAPQVRARSFVLTDFGCGSACLDAVDQFTGLGAMQVGQETSADTLYMEIRQQKLDSGARMWIPMKVYRGRKRGSNEPAVPKHAWTGDMADTPAIRAWIAGSEGTERVARASSRMRIATYNVNGVNGRLAVLLRWLAETQPDVVCLQELKAPEEKLPEAAIRDAGYGAVWHGQKSWNGVAILARGCDPVETRRGLPGDPEDVQSRYIEAAVNGVLVGGLYLPNGNPRPGPKFEYKLRWMERLILHAEGLIGMDAPVVLAGDYNVMPTDLDVYKPERWLDDALFAPEARAAYFRLLEQGWTDALRHLHPGETIYTFWDYFRNAYGRNAGLRIDHLLLNKPAAKRLKAAEVDAFVRGWEKTSDHAPVWIELK